MNFSSYGPVEVVGADLSQEDADTKIYSALEVVLDGLQGRMNKFSAFSMAEGMGIDKIDPNLFNASPYSAQFVEQYNLLADLVSKVSVFAKEYQQNPTSESLQEFQTKAQEVTEAKKAESIQVQATGAKGGFPWGTVAVVGAVGIGAYMMFKGG